MDNVNGVACWGCGASIDPQDGYCKHCGQGQGARLAWYYRPWGIALATFLGLGPFGLILVWRSPALSRSARWVATLLIAGFSVWTFIGFYQAYMTAKNLLATYLADL